MDKDALNVLKFISVLAAVVFLGSALILEVEKTPVNDHTGFQMETVKTGDVTWACLKHNGEYVGCDTVEECK